jgi:elongation factor 2
VYHGKSTLTDAMFCMSGIIASNTAGDTRYRDSTGNEEERGSTTKSTSIPMYFQIDQEDITLIKQKAEGIYPVNYTTLSGLTVS